MDSKILYGEDGEKMEKLMAEIRAFDEKYVEELSEENAGYVITTQPYLMLNFEKNIPKELKNELSAIMRKYYPEK